MRRGSTFVLGSYLAVVVAKSAAVPTERIQIIRRVKRRSSGSVKIRMLFYVITGVVLRKVR
jgi:hypothetical protein